MYRKFANLCKIQYTYVSLYVDLSIFKAISICQLCKTLVLYMHLPKKLHVVYVL